MRFAAITIAVAATGPISVAHADRTICPDAGTTIVVDTGTRTLALCDAGAAVEEYPVAIGGGGVGKEKEGDGKTPIGTYALGAPRRSSDYGTFIPIGYPTEDQRKRGLTGGSIGIHGPDRRLKSLGRVAVALGWTSGCVAVSSDVEMRSIARWVRVNRGRRTLSIEIR